VVFTLCVYLYAYEVRKPATDLQIVQAYVYYTLTRQVISLAVEETLPKPDIHELADRYLELGFALIPLNPYEKKDKDKAKEPLWDLLPRVKGKRCWRPLILRPATAPEVHDWLDRYPNMNLGIITGEASGIVVLDVDKPAKLPKGFRIPATPTVRTSRGWHYYLAIDGPVKSKVLPYGELKGEGSYVVAPPSVHPSGRRYEWVDCLRLDDVPLASFSAVQVECERLRAVPRRNISSGYHSLKRPLSRHTPDTQLEPSSPSVAVTTISTNQHLVPHQSTDFQPRAGRQAVVETSVPLQQQESLALAIIEQAGVSGVEIGKAFRCVLPGHDERNPSASLYRMDDGNIMYRDWHCRGDQEWFTLGEVYQALVTGKVRTLNSGERKVWLCRAAVELGFLDPPSLIAPRLPDDAPRGVRRVYDGFVYLLRCRMIHDPEQRTAPYTYDFINRWTGVRRNDIAKALKWLRANRYLVRKDIQKVNGRKCGLFSLGPGPGRSQTRT